MLERIVAFALQQRVFVLILTIALCAFGVRSALNLPIEAFPDVQDVQVQIVTQYSGQAPEEVAGGWPRPTGVRCRRDADHACRPPAGAPRRQERRSDR